MKSLRVISYILAFWTIVFVHGLFNDIAHANIAIETATEDCLNASTSSNDINFDPTCALPIQLSNNVSLNLPVRLLRHSQRSGNFTFSRLQSNWQNAMNHYEKTKQHPIQTTSKTTNFPAPYHFSENHIYSNCNLRL